MGQVKITDVAKAAGVSLKTVSRVLNKEPSVKAKTREKVEATIKRLDYQPNSAARNLRGLKSWALGLVYDNPNAYYIMDAQEGVLDACRNAGYGLQILPTFITNEGAIELLLTQVRTNRLAGLILLPPMSEHTSFLEELTKNNIKYIRIISGCHPVPEADHAIQIDDRAAAVDITNHLIEQGHQRIAFLAGSVEHNSTPERLDGYKKALQNSGIAIDPELILEGEYTYRSGFDRTLSLIDKGIEFTAIFGCNDEIAAGAVTALNSRGRRIPDDVAVAGFEDSEFAHIMEPPLTTSRQSITDISRMATNLLIQELRPNTNSPAGDTLVPGMNNLIYTPQLIVRNSTSS